MKVVVVVKIKNIIAREIFDSRGVPTLETDLHLEDETIITSSVPSGISRGMHEMVEIRDGGQRLNGLGVQKAVEIIENIIAPMFLGREPDLINMDVDMIE